jgi:hypothetical protein
VCLLAACHDILRPAVTRYLTTCKPAKQSPFAGPDRDHMQLVAYEGAIGETDLSDPTFWREFNSRQAKQLRSFVEEYKLAELLVMRTTLGPLSALLHKMLHMRSPAWSERP